MFTFTVVRLMGRWDKGVVGSGIPAGSVIGAGAGRCKD